MSKNFRLLVLALLTLIISSAAFAGQYSEAFPQYLADHRSDAMVTAIVSMADRVDLRALQDGLYAQHADRRLWHETVVRALQTKATESQADLLATLASLAQSGQVEKYTSLWVGNIVIVTATPAVFDQLVTRNDVLQISPDYPIGEIEPVSRGGDTPSIAGHEIGLDRLHVPEVWAMGFTGDGRLVSHLDTGVDGDHPAYNYRWRGVADSRYDGHPGWAWFDPVTNTEFPFDSGQHGTHTMGTICGRSTTTSDTVGVAIDAQWISCGVIDRGGIGPTVTNALLSFQWIVDPDEDPGTVWDVPDVNSNSWGLVDSHGYPPCDETFWSVLDGCEAAGIVVVFAAGNEGPGPNSLRRPADRAITDLTSFSVGAVDGNNQNLPIADFSSRGPSYCTPDGNETFKPEVVAPGVNVRSSIPGGGYQGGWSGTSMATPHIAGIIALMRQANPNLTSEQVRQILIDTADDLGSEGEDNTYGMGVANAVTAVQRALAYLQGWGTLGGVITDQASGNPIQGARVSVVGRPWSASSRANGQYFLFMPADTSWNIRVEFPPTHLPITDVVTVVENDTLIRNYALEGKVPTILTASFGNPADVSYRSFFLKGSWNSDGFYDAGWSAPQIEIKDDGNGPDPTAGDGIFTGRVLLARDLTHTYSWAIYTENYGGENARLQHGANFQITTLTPPTVPTLSVNPSGSDHNWGFSVLGDHGLALDLARNDLTHPFVWSGAESLQVGVTYTFRFRVMHSDSSVYGNGGVGGTPIPFTPTFDGPYEFKFDDRTDAYVVQLVGTEGPPTYFSARSGLDHHVILSWLPPGTVESQEMAYDDGTLANAYYYYDDANLMAEMFVPNSWPVTIDSAMVHVLTDGDAYWPWPDGTHDPINVFIYLDDGFGYPQADPVFTTEATGEPGAWIVVDVPDIQVDQGYFWIAMGNIMGDGEEGIGLDQATDYPANKWNLFSGSWIQQDLYAGDHMIRAKVFGGGRDGWMGYDSTPAGEISSRVQHGGDASLMAATCQTQPNGGSSSRIAYTPRLSPTNPPVILDIQVHGYNLYRSLAAGPYNGGDSTYRVNAAEIHTTNYDDWGGRLGRIVNGTTYHYQASALYDVGGGQLVEVGPSNEAVATPLNGPPMAPFNVAGSVTDRTIHVTWSWANRDSDVVMFNVYKKQLPGGAQLLAGQTTDSTFNVVIPTGEDGIWRVTITAVDDGAPPMESEPSRGVEEPIGHLPPGALTALSDYEFAVPLRWLRPGAYRALGAGTPGAPANNTPATPQPLDLSQKGETGPQNPPMILGRGGPDAFGYTWVDSDEPDGPSYDWIDITDRGVQIPMSMDDENQGPFDIGFDVSFYGNTFSQFHVCSNGWVSFTDMNAYYFNQPLPSANQTPFDLIAPFWDDFYPPNGGEYWYYSDGSQLIVSFINLMGLGGGGPHTFQVVIRPSGTTVFNYQTLDLSYLNSCTIGIQNSDGSVGLQVAYDQDYLHDNMSIRISSGLDGFEPVHYKLYRSLVADVPLDPAHLLNGSIPGDAVNYVDYYHITNGITYYYKLTAVWPDSIESPGSNMASGTPANHPPLAPYNLAGVVIDRNVNLHWTFNDSLHDFNHFNVWKKLMPGGTFALAGTTTDTLITVNIPVGQDGVWGFAVSAVDNGTPPLEGELSREVDLPIGHLTPTELRATSGEEFAIPLHWNLPGGWRGFGAPIPGIPTTNTVVSNTQATPAQPLDLSHKGETGPQNPPVILDRGGPDAYGYTWVDSDEPDGPAYEWIDITGIGTQIPMSMDDQNLGPFDVGFDFNFYGTAFNQFYVCSNGWLSFTSTDQFYTNQPLPGNAYGYPFNLIAPFWDDLYPPYGGEYWYYSDGNQLVISFINVMHIGSGGPYTFQVVLRQAGSMLFEYQSLSTPTNECTVGIQNADGTIGLQMTYNADYLHDEMAVRIGTGPEGFPPVHYKLYRSTAPGVPLDPAHLITSMIQGDLTSYNDRDNLRNGVAYYYKLTAVWPDSVESDPTNEASGTPANHPPEAPYNLHGSVDARNITVFWSFTNLMGDFAHYNVWKKQVPGGTWAFVGSTTDTTYIVIIPAGQDGVYQIAATAVDNGTPALESDRSNSPAFPVGNLPPNALVADDGLEGHVPLHWAEPGLLPTTTITYDDGVLANAYYYYDDANLMAEQFVATAPVQLDTIWVHVLTDGDQYWPWPDGSHDPINVMVFEDDGSGQPAFDPIFTQEATCEPGQWIMVPIDGGLQIATSNFWIAMGNLPDGGEEGIGLDLTTDFPQYKWNLFNGSWISQDLYTGDHMIRATIVDNGRSLLLSEQAPTEDLARNHQPSESAYSGVNTTPGARRSSDLPTLMGAGAASGTQSQTMSLHSGYGDNPRPLDTEVLVGYNIYKGTSPNVPIEPAYLLRGYQLQGISRTYDDSAVVNGTTYYYKVTAEYDNDGVFEESPPSNEETGLPTNHPPQTPFGLAGSVDGRNVLLHWSFFNLNRDLHHFNIYKKIVPGGTYALAGTSTDSSATIVIPAGQDGVYAFVVSSVDNGTPQLESGYSNSVFLNVGLLPPINLRARTDQDGYVPLTWSEPGLRPTTTITYDDGVLANAYYYYDDANLMAEQFVATAPVQLDTIWVHVLTDGDAYWPWPDGTHDPVGISVFSDDGSGQPGDQLFYQEAACEPGAWIMIDIEGGLEIPTENFWIAMANLPDGGEEGIGLDLVTDFPQYKWNLFDGSWISQDLYSGDHMIRATIVDNGRSILLSEKAPTEELALKANPVTFGSADGIAPTISTQGTVAAGNIGGDNPRPLDTEVLVGYSIYRSTSPDVPIDDSHRIRHYSAQGLSRAYNDSAVVNGTTYYYKVTAVYLNNSIYEESPGSNEVSATPRLGARMVVNPLSFNVSGMPGHTGSAPLNISNPGGIDLNYTIVAQSDRLLLDRSHRNNGFIDAAHNPRVTVDKSNYHPTRPNNPPVLLGRGGPDEFGYQWIDSDEQGGPSYGWEDITDRGTSISLGDDETQGPFEIGFNFSFYGQAFSSFNICSNGFISFTSFDSPYESMPIPDPSAPQNLIAPFWDDLSPNDGGEIWYYSDGAQLIISYINVPHFDWGSGLGPYTYQVILGSNGSMKFNYMDMQAPLNECTIGIQNGDGSIGLQIASDQDYLHNELAVSITSGWLSADPTSGVIAAGNNRNVNIVFDATLLDIGVYNGTLLVTGTDANHQVGQVSIPVTFHVVQDVVDDPTVDLPKEFGLSQNYPNPFNPTTEIEFALPVGAHVTLDVYNVMGQKVKSLVNSDLEAGYKSITWNGSDNSGISVASGTYFYVLKAGDKVFTKKMTMLK